MLTHERSDVLACSKQLKNKFPFKSANYLFSKVNITMKTVLTVEVRQNLNLIVSSYLIDSMYSSIPCSQVRVVSRMKRLTQNRDTHLKPKAQPEVSYAPSRSKLKPKNRETTELPSKDARRDN